MPFMEEDGAIKWDYFDDEEVAILLAERFVLALSNKHNNVIGSMISGIESEFNRALFDYDHYDMSYSTTNKFGFYKKILSYTREYPIHSKHIAGAVNSQDYWIEEFKNKTEQKMWLAFCPVLIDADVHVYPDHSSAIATNKKITYPQNVELNVGNVEEVKIDYGIKSETVKPINGIVKFVLDKTPVFVVETEDGDPEEPTCSELGGNICSTNETCSGDWLDASDNERCCDGECGGSTTSDYEDSPFGIFGPNEHTLDSPEISTSEELNIILTDLGADWVTWHYFEKKYTANVNLFASIGFEGGGILPNLNEIPSTYQPALREVIKANKEYVKFWNVQTEPGGAGGWFDNPEGYVKLLKASYEVIKDECPDCMLSIGGLSGVSNDSGATSQPAVFLKNVLKNGGGNYFDVFEFKQHHHSVGMYKEIGVRYNTFKKILGDYGKDIDSMPVFLETAMYSSNVAVDHFPIFPELPPQTEGEQAGGLIKTYVYSVALGIDTILWDLFERHNFGDSETNIFNFYGLINNPLNPDGLSHKKLAYYTYKKMVEKLEGSDWDNIETVRESDGIYVYKFTRSSGPVWVAWTDNESDAQITISGMDAEGALITEAVPSYESGLEVKDYAAAFSSHTYAVSGGEVTITISSHSPVFVEPSSVLQEDTTPPTVSITSPADGSTVSGSVTISATASDNIGVSKVELYVDETLKATDGTSPYSFSLNTTELSDGSHTIMAKAFDAAGNIGVSKTLEIILEKTQSEAVTVYPNDNTIIVANSYRTS
ncbi:hypothetical protein KJ656_14030, partial [bacterium]|nr:hypothetical protein [bacterium]